MPPSETQKKRDLDKFFLSFLNYIIFRSCKCHYCLDSLAQKAAVSHVGRATTSNDGYCTFLED